jgi:lysozyme
MTPDLFERTVAREGWRSHPYRDSRGIWTIGIGHNIEADRAMLPRLGALMANGITEAEARALFAHDSQDAINGLDAHLPWWRQLDDVRQDVMFDMAFNMGVAGFVLWHHTLGDIQAHRFPQAAADMIASAWDQQVGRRAKADEQEMLTGREVRL